MYIQNPTVISYDNFVAIRIIIMNGSGSVVPRRQIVDRLGQSGIANQESNRFYPVSGIALACKQYQVESVNSRQEKLPSRLDHFSSGSSLIRNQLPGWRERSDLGNY